MSVQTLVALDFDGGTDVAPLVAALGAALVQHEETTIPHWRTGEPVTCHRLAFDAGQLRNTEAHGLGFRAGFVVHVES